MKRISRYAVSLFAVCYTLAARSEQQADHGSDTAATPTATVVVTGSADSYNPRRDDTAAKIVVNREELKKYGDTNVLDVLRRQPGVVVTGETIRMRGLGEGYTQILLNGEHLPPGFSIATLSPDVIERIEILPSASAELSTQSIAGTINIILRKTIDPGKREFSFGYGREKWERTPVASFQVSEKADSLSYSVSGNVRHSIATRSVYGLDTATDLQGNVISVQPSTINGDVVSDGINLTSRFVNVISPSEKLNGQIFVNANRYDNHGHEVDSALVGPPFAMPNTLYLQDGYNRTARADLGWDRNLEAGKIEIKLGIQDNRGLSNSRRLSESTDLLASRLTNIKNRTKADTVTSQGHYKNDFNGVHAWSTGWDMSSTSANETRLQTDRWQPAMSVPDIDESSDAQIRRLALYAQDEWTMSPQASTYLGGRWEGVRTETTGTSFSSAKVSSSVFSPILQTLYKFSGTSGEQVRFAVARTYKAPSGRDLAQRRLESLNNSPVQPDYIGNYLLRPELAWGYDATYERFGKDGAMLSVNASLRKIDDAIRRVVLQDVNGRWVSEPINGGKAESRTLAFEFRLPGKRFTENLKGLDLRGSVNKNWSRVDQVPGPDNRLDQQVPLSATLAFDYRTGALSYGASWAFREGAQIQVSQEQRAKLQTARDIDLYAVWRASANASIRLAVSNLAGTDRITDDSYTNGNERVRRLFVVPYAPKVQLTCELKY